MKLVINGIEEEVIQISSKSPSWSQYVIVRQQTAMRSVQLPTKLMPGIVYRIGGVEAKLPEKDHGDE